MTDEPMNYQRAAQTAAETVRFQAQDDLQIMLTSAPIDSAVRALNTLWPAGGTVCACPNPPTFAGDPARCTRCKGHWRGDVLPGESLHCTPDGLCAGEGGTASCPIHGDKPNPVDPLGLLLATTLRGTTKMRKFVITNPAGDRYLTRYVIEEHPGGSAIYLHLIHRSDDDREYHDHPFAFRSFIVSGGYIEYEPGKPGRLYGPGDWNVREDPAALHRLELVSPGEPTMTIVYRGPKVREWGFSDGPGKPWVHNEAYLASKFPGGYVPAEYE